MTWLARVVGHVRSTPGFLGGILSVHIVESIGKWITSFYGYTSLECTVYENIYIYIYRTLLETDMAPENLRCCKTTFLLIWSPFSGTIALEDIKTP